MGQKTEKKTYTKHKYTHTKNEFIRWDGRRKWYHKPTLNFFPAISWVHFLRPETRNHIWYYCMLNVNRINTCQFTTNLRAKQSLGRWIHSLSQYIVIIALWTSIWTFPTQFTFDAELLWLNPVSPSLYLSSLFLDIYVTLSA